MTQRTASIIDGKAIAREISETIAKELSDQGANPKITVFMIGNNEASKIYVRNKKRMCRDANITMDTVNFEGTESQHEIIESIKKVNDDPTICGLFIQLPIPETYDLKQMLACISVTKDLDGLKAENMGSLCLREPVIRPCTSMGVIHLLKTVYGDLSGKNVCIVGASNLVGRPLAMECLLQACTVTVCHRFTTNLKSHTLAADIIISAVGKADMITADMVRNGATVIDVGITRRENGAICGDVDFENVSKKASHITPVPGGVGPMTIAMLLQNVYLAHKLLPPL